MFNFVFGISLAQVKDHVETIKDGKNLEDTNDNKKRPTTIFFDDIIQSSFEFILIPFFPILYEELKFPNPNDQNVNHSSSWQAGLSVGGGGDIKADSAVLIYKNKVFKLNSNFLRNTERNSTADFFSIGAQYLPNWNRLLKTGIGIGFRSINYSDRDISTSGNAYGGFLDFTSELSIDKDFGVYLSPRYFFYNGGVSTFEISGGFTYAINSKWVFKIGFERKKVIESAKGDFGYFDMGISYLF